VADILSQQEIDALLSANDGDMPSLADHLAKYGVDNKGIATLFREINGLGMSDLEADACEKSALAALNAAIEGRGVSKRQRTGLRTIVKGRIAEQNDKKRQRREKPW
jgi:hypothetical protein